ncbi:MAG: amidohydrolase [Actinomycetota bacterium]|nr:amidohydrolase [Actinomycetota bacterium]
MPRSPLNNQLAELVEEITPQAVELRRLLHRHPEPGFQEHQTTALISATLRENGLAHELRKPNTGLWVDIGNDPSVGFRADLDALPITEPEDNLPRSQNPGWMHACGHDAHSAIATGIALTLNRLDLDQGVRVLFQPAEESYPSGASELVAEGLVDGLKGLIAFHVDPNLDTGKVGAKTGPITGSADGFTITLNGPGGHTARPNRTVDLVDASARVIGELPGAIRRSIDSRIPIVTVFGSVHGGDALNVIPTEVVMSGTVRTLDRAVWDVLPGLVDKALGSLLAVSGADYHLDYRQGIPPVVNDGGVVEAASAGITLYAGDDTIVPTDTSMGGEDFAHYLDIVPGALLRLGTCCGGGDLHSASFKINEATIGFGIKAGVGALIGMTERI